MADCLQGLVADMASQIGTNGRPLDGGIWMFAFDDAARTCGVLETEPPFGVPNGTVAGSIALTNEWWIRPGALTNTIYLAAGMA